MNTAHSFGLDAAGLHAASPFHCVIDQSDNVLQVGSSLAILLPELVNTGRLNGLMQVANPPGPTTYKHLLQNTGRLVVFDLPQHNGLTIRAQAIPGPNNVLILVGTPWFTELEKIGACGLSMKDFAPHESVLDLLLLIQSQAVSLLDSTTMSESLSELNQQLEERVLQRTQALAEKTSALESEINDRHRIEAELRLAQRLESVGQLAAGIAHEINTPIQFVGDNLRFIGDTLKDLLAVIDELPRLIAVNNAGGFAKAQSDQAQSVIDHADLPYLLGELPKSIEQSIEGVGRVTALVGALKEFSHPDAGEHKPNNLNHAVENTLVVARNEYKYVAEVSVDLDPQLPLTTCNLGEINQVLLNLLVNAAHAVGDALRPGDRGSIIVSTRTNGDWVEIAITDTGTGIPEAVRSRIFDPFFTTKPVGKGTGQGLYLVHSIITKKHNGTVTFTTELGKGTTFFIRLPLKPLAIG
jgi:signal transduction histidine kinase